MKKIFLLAPVFLIVVSCNNTGKDSETSDTTSTSTTRTDNTTVSETTRNFFTTVANSGMVEVELTQMGKDKATNQSVKDLSAMLYNDHQALNQQVQSLASQKNISLPDSISADKRKMIDDLRSKSGKDFEKDYLEGLIKAHESSISLFESTASGDPDSDVRNFAGQTLPTLRAHRDSAAALKKKLY